MEVMTTASTSGSAIMPSQSFPKERMPYLAAVSSAAAAT